MTLESYLPPDVAPEVPGHGIEELLNPGSTPLRWPPRWPPYAAVVIAGSGALVAYGGAPFGFDLSIQLRSVSLLVLGIAIASLGLVILGLDRFLLNRWSEQQRFRSRWHRDSAERRALVFARFLRVRPGDDGERICLDLGYLSTDGPYLVWRGEFYAFALLYQDIKDGRRLPLGGCVRVYMDDPDRWNVHYIAFHDADPFRRFTFWPCPTILEWASE